jgi:hypothetical protein
MNEQVEKCTYSVTVLTYLLSLPLDLQVMNTNYFTNRVQLKISSKNTDKYILNAPFHFIHNKHIRADVR